MHLKKTRKKNYIKIKVQSLELLDKTDKSF